MSDTQQGPEWWLASDGKWYPPQDETPPVAPPPVEPPPTAPGTPPLPGSTASVPAAAPPMGGAYQPPGAAATSNSTATVSLVLGIISLFFCGLFTGIPAIFLGLKARKEVAASDGRETGDGLALGGIITGAIGTLITTIAIVAFVALVIFADSVSDNLDNGINTDPSDGICNSDRFLQDPDC